MDPIWQQLLLFIVSVIANLFSAFAGGGAGLIQFPVLIFLGLSFGVALATHKIASVALGLGATIRHMREGGLERRFALFILACGLPGVITGAMVILDVPDRWARLALGVLTIGLGLYSMANRRLGLEHVPGNRHFRGYVTGGLVLYVIGVLNGSLTSGTGLFCHPVAGALVRAGLPACGCLHAGAGGRVLEWCRCRHPGHSWQCAVVVVAGIVAGVADRRLPGRALVHRQGKPLDQARLRDNYHPGGPEAAVVRVQLQIARSRCRRIE